MNFTESSHSANDVFLKSRTGTFSYQDLDNYTSRLKNWMTKHWAYYHKPKIALEADSSDDLLLTMAACWNLGIPFASIDVAFISRAKIERINPELFFGRTQTVLDKFDVVHIPALTYDSIKACSPDGVNAMSSVTPDDVFAYLLTSGSSGRTKIVPAKRRQITHSAHESSSYLRPDPQGLWLHCLPLNHIGGIGIIPRSLLYNTGIYRADGFDAETISALISEDPQIQAVSLVPTMLKRLLNFNSFKPNPNLKAIVLGGGPVSTEIVKAAHKRGFPIITSYGMTETCGMYTVEKYTLDNGLSSGKPLGDNEVKIVDEVTNAPAAPEETGAILLKGPQIFDGYAEEEKNKDAFDEEGWFHTGDFGTMDASGRLTVEARRTDMIITGGENVSPYEIEAIINNLPGVSESAVTGVPDEEWGQKIIALISFELKELEDIPQIQTSLKQLLPPFKVPKVIQAVQTLPKSSLGKLQREKVRTLATDLQ
ncbi:MAG: class I adenylate-forming enzyme family protein [Balneolales bacterium]